MNIYIIFIRSQKRQTLLAKIRLYIPLPAKIRLSKHETHDKIATIALLPVALLLGDHIIDLKPCLHP